VQSFSAVLPPSGIVAQNWLVANSTTAAIRSCLVGK
jgi:hypothetical protein